MGAPTPHNGKQLGRDFGQVLRVSILRQKLKAGVKGSKVGAFGQGFGLVVGSRWGWLVWICPTVGGDWLGQSSGG